MLDDPTAPVIYRTSGDMPYPPNGSLPPGIAPRQVILRDRVTIATLIPFSSPDQVPITLLAYLADQLGREIEKGDTYPMIDPLPLEAFGPYWFGVFGAIMLMGDIPSIEEIHRMAREGHDWEKACLGSFYIKPNYPGRSSHVCNGGFLVTDGARNRGVGRLMGEQYLEWAPKLVGSLPLVATVLSDVYRATHIQSSTSSTRPTLRRAAYGTHSASNELDVSRVQQTSDHILTSLLTQSYTVETSAKTMTLCQKSDSTRFGSISRTENTPTEPIEQRKVVSEVQQHTISWCQPMATHQRG